MGMQNEMNLVNDFGFLIHTFISKMCPSHMFMQGSHMLAMFYTHVLSE